MLLICGMKSLKILLPILCLIIFFSSCIVSKINPNALTSYDEAEQTIMEIKNNGIVLVFPTDYKKERVLRSISKTKVSAKNDIQEIIKQRKERQKTWRTAIKNYGFSNVSIIPDSLLKSYIENPKGIEARDIDNNIQQRELNDVYVLYTEFGGFEVKKNGSFIPNPFPNQIKPSKWASIRDFLGVQGDEKSITSFFTELNSEFNQYYTYCTQKESATSQ